MKASSGILSDTNDQTPSATGSWMSALREKADPPAVASEIHEIVADDILD